MRTICLLLLCLLLPTAVALAAPTFTLTERLGENWTQELTTFALPEGDHTFYLYGVGKA